MKEAFFLRHQHLHLAENQPQALLIHILRATHLPQRRLRQILDKLVQFDRPREVRNSYPVVPPANEVYVIKPMEFDDAQTVVDFLASGKAIVINMEGLQLDSARENHRFHRWCCVWNAG